MTAGPVVTAVLTGPPCGIVQGGPDLGAWLQWQRGGYLAWCLLAQWCLGWARPAFILVWTSAMDLSANLQISSPALPFGPSGGDLS